MKRTLSFLLALLLVTGATEMHQLLKIPFLIQHFRDHKSEHPLLSFFGFLKIHYTNTNHPDDNDDNEDNELPFKSPGNIFHLDTPVLARRIVAKIIICSEEKTKNRHPEGVPSHRSYSIFHPPRIA